MGGSGAKNRRKLERQEAEAKAIESSSTSSDKKFARKLGPHKKGPNTKKPHVAKKKPAAKKFKKPKHLKRKLEVVAQTSEEKSKILQQMKDLASLKKTKKATHSPSPHPKLRNEISRKETNCAGRRPVEIRSPNPSNQKSKYTGSASSETGYGGQEQLTSHPAVKRNNHHLHDTPTMQKRDVKPKRRRGRAKEKVTAGVVFGHEGATTKVATLPPLPHNTSKLETRRSVEVAPMSSKTRFDATPLKPTNGEQSIKVAEPLPTFSRTFNQEKVCSSIDDPDLKPMSSAHMIAAKSLKPTIASSSTSVNGNGSESDDSEKGSTPKTSRARGKGRKGRKDTSLVVEERNLSTSAALPVTEEVYDPEDSIKHRRCVGRKPLTDFKVGESYPAKVVYVKPFGVFLDIGCHSDAFCHVSRMRDDFVEAPENMFSEGDGVPAVRVVEIDRRRKRITVSLQSEARASDEVASMQARKSRKEKHRRSVQAPAIFQNRTGITQSNDQKGSDPRNVRDGLPDPQPPKLAIDPLAEAAKKSESEMTHAELKRLRKLTRRAERRGDSLPKQ